MRGDAALIVAWPRVLDDVDEDLHQPVAVDAARRQRGELAHDLEALRALERLRGEIERGLDLLGDRDDLHDARAAGVALLGLDEHLDVLDPLAHRLDLGLHARALGLELLVDRAQERQQVLALGIVGQELEPGCRRAARACARPWPDRRRPSGARVRRRGSR
jgi:ParB-like chromosome segregation protein Spo0J